MRFARCVFGRLQHIMLEPITTETIDAPWERGMSGTSKGREAFREVISFESVPGTNQLVMRGRKHTPDSGLLAACGYVPKRGFVEFSGAEQKVCRACRKAMRASI